MTDLSIDHAALAPAYAIAGAAVLVLLLDVFIPADTPDQPLRWRTPLLLSAAALGPLAAIVTALAITGTKHRASFCLPPRTLPGNVDVGPACSFVTGRFAVTMMIGFCLLALVVLTLSAIWMTHENPPTGEYAFLLLASLLGGVILTGARDLLTLIVALETLTLPSYVLVSLGWGRRSADAGLTFFVISVVSMSVTLLGGGLLYALTGAIHFSHVDAALASRDDLSDLPLTSVAVVLVVAGLLFKLAAVPFHSWAPATYDGAPIPIASWLATASKLGGLIAVLTVTVGAFESYLDILGVIFAAVAIATILVGNLGALRQRRLMRLLAWSSVAQVGYVLAPLGLLAGVGSADEVTALVAGSLAYFGFYVLIILGVFGAVVVIRCYLPDDAGFIEDYRGLLRRWPLPAGLLLFGLVGLAGLPPGFAGLWAKVAIIRAVFVPSVGWWTVVVALIVAIGIVIGLAYYLRVVRVLVAPDEASASPAAPRFAISLVSVVTLLVSGGVVLLGFFPQPLLHIAENLASDLQNLWK